jgi:F-type H+-transporting ATPase subunit b
MSKIISDAQATIETQKMAAITELKNQVGKLVIEVSEKILRKELSNKDDQEKYIKQLAETVRLN